MTIPELVFFRKELACLGMQIELNSIKDGYKFLIFDAEGYQVGHPLSAAEVTLLIFKRLSPPSATKEFFNLARQLLEKNGWILEAHDLKYNLFVIFDVEGYQVGNIKKWEEVHRLALQTMQ